MLAAPITNTVMCAPGPSTTPNWYTHNNTTVHLSQPTQLSTSICGPAGHSYRSAAEAEQPTKVAWAEAGGTSIFCFCPVMALPALQICWLPQVCRAAQSLEAC